jgi:hypothetical protein
MQEDSPNAVQRIMQTGAKTLLALSAAQLLASGGHQTTKEQTDICSVELNLSHA